MSQAVSTSGAFQGGAAEHGTGPSGKLARAWMGLRAGVRLALDPNDTKQVSLLAAALDWPRLATLQARLAERPAWRALRAERPIIDSRHVDYEALRRLPPDSLGGAYARSLDAQGLDPDLFQDVPALDPELAYIVQRIRQTHDIWHVLTGLGTDVPGEILLQAFTFGQLGNRTSRTLVTMGLVLFGARYPRLFKQVPRWYRNGQRCTPWLEVRWEDHWQEPLDSVRARFALPLC